MAEGESGKVLIVGEARWPIEADRLPVEFCDLVLEARQGMNIVYLSLGAAIIDGASKPTVRVTSRMRMSLVMAQNLRDVLTNIIADALKPADKSQTN